MLMVRAGTRLSVRRMRIESLLSVGKKLTYKSGRKVGVQTLAIPISSTISGPEVDKEPSER